jgi:hypothetical protein
MSAAAARPLVYLAAAVAAAALAGPALAVGGNYTFAGGTPQQRAQVRAALDASSFDWSLVPAQITIHIVRGHESEATYREIWLDADLLNSNRFAWGTVQHEYAHQVDFFLLDDAERSQLQDALGGSDWCHDVAGLPHADYSCERFASTLAWAYWQSPLNAMRPSTPRDESAAMAPSAFRTLLARIVGPVVR